MTDEKVAVVIGAGDAIAPRFISDPDAIAEIAWRLHMQPKSAWTHELDIRPWIEKW